MTARDKFTGIEAEFWDCEDPEVLLHTDSISALAACVENHLEPGRLAEDVIREMGSIEICAYRKRLHSPGAITAAAERALDAATEALDDDEHGHPEGDEPMFTIDVLKKHLPAFEAVLRALVADARMWQCEVSRRVELTPDEAIEILLVERPEWFESPAAGERVCGGA